MEMNTDKPINDNAQSIKKVNVKQELHSVNDLWKTHTIGELNNQHIKVAKFKGTFDWHKHDEEDGVMMVINGNLQVDYLDKEVMLNEGEFLIIPRGVAYRVIAEEEVGVMVFKPA